MHLVSCLSALVQGRKTNMNYLFLYIYYALLKCISFIFLVKHNENYSVLYATVFKLLISMLKFFKLFGLCWNFPSCSFLYWNFPKIALYIISSQFSCINQPIRPNCKFSIQQSSIARRHVIFQVDSLHCTESYTFIRIVMYNSKSWFN